MLSRAALSCAARSASFIRPSAALASRAFCTAPAKVSTTLDAVPYTKQSMGDHARFDPSQWLTNETDPSVRSELTRIRQAESETIAALSKDVPDIDWDHWESQIDAPGLVAKLKKAYSEVPILNMDEERERMQKEIREKFEPLLMKVEAHAIEAGENEKLYKKRLEEVRHLHDNLEEIPLEDFLAKYPAVKKSLEDDILKNKWFV